MDTKMRAIVLEEYDTDVIEKIVTKEPEIPVYVPYARYNTPGIASFKSSDFHVEPTGKVQLSDEIYRIRDDAENAATEAAESAQAAAQSESNAKQSENAASQSESNALSSENAARASQLVAESAKTAAEAAEAGAESAQNAAEAAQTAAETAQGKAETAQSAAETAQGKAETAQAVAEAAQTAAETAEGNAKTSETNAGTYAGNASGSASAAAQSATQAQAYMEQAKQYAQKEYQIYDSFDELPVPGNSAYIYLVPVSGGSGNDSYSEYLWITETNKYEFIGNLNDVDLSNYAQVNGTYPNMTVGKATKAEQDASGNNIASTYATKTELTKGLAGKQPTGNYALQTGTYAGMTVGNAMNAENAEHAASADSATDAQAAAQADKLATARTMQVNLASSNEVEFDGTENVTPGVTGILPVANGGTGASSLANVTVGNAAKATQDGDGNIIPDTYAKQSGTYPNMTVGNATNAQKLGNVDVSQYAQKTGMYPNMTVGNAQFAKSLANSLYVRQSATGWYKIAEFTITGSNYNAFSVIILVNGIYGTQTSGDVEESGLLEFDIRKTPDGIVSTECYLSILAGNLRTDRFAFNISGNTASLYWYQDFEYSSVKFTILDSKAENDDEYSYKLVTIPNGGFPTGGEYAHNVAKAESDSAGNSISSTYAKKSAFNTSSIHLSSFLSGVSGWGDIYLSGKLGICTFSISLSSRVNAWTDKYIFNWSTIPAMYRPVTGIVFGFLSCDSNDAWMQAGICACDGTGVKINGQSHTIDSGRALVGTLVYIAYGSI